MFAYRHDILKAMIADGVKLVVLGPGRTLSDLPEIKSLSDKSSLDLLARSLNYSPATKLLVVAEENLAADVHQPGVGESQLIRVLSGEIQQLTGQRPSDGQWDARPAACGSNMNWASSASTSVSTSECAQCPGAPIGPRPPCRRGCPPGGRPRHR